MDLLKPDAGVHSLLQQSHQQTRTSLSFWLCPKIGFLVQFKDFPPPPETPKPLPNLAKWEWEIRKKDISFILLEKLGQKTKEKATLACLHYLHCLTPRLHKIIDLNARLTNREQNPQWVIFNLYRKMYPFTLSQQVSCLLLRLTITGMCDSLSRGCWLHTAKTPIHFLEAAESQLNDLSTHFQP